MSHVKSKAFYDEAEAMEEGWGRYLKKIDILKDKVDDMEDITLNEACWVLYGERYLSQDWNNFSEFCLTKSWEKRVMPWESWKGLFDKFQSKQK